MDYETALMRGIHSRKSSTQTNEPPKIVHQEHEWLHWTFLILAIAGNAIVGIALIPVLIGFNDLPLFGSIIVFGLLFGFLFDIVVRDVQTIGKEKIKAIIFIPAVAIINIYFMVSLTNYATAVLRLPSKINSPTIISALYVAAFTIPYIIHGVLKSRAGTNTMQMTSVPPRPKDQGLP